MNFKHLLSSLLITSLMTSTLFAQKPGEPPITAPYPEKLDRAAANKWWEVARGWT